MIGIDLHFIKKIESNSEFDAIRKDVDYLMRVDPYKFAYEFDIITDRLKYPFKEGIDPFTGKFIPAPAEAYFMYYLKYKIDRTHDILSKYYATRDEVQPKTDEDLSGVYEKMEFYYRRLQKFLNLNSTSCLSEEIESYKNSLGSYDIEGKSNHKLSFKIDITEIELSEIIKALIQANIIHSYKSEKEVFRILAEVLNLNFDKREKLQTIKSRTKEKTPFLNRLTVALENWINGT